MSPRCCATIIAGPAPLSGIARNSPRTAPRTAAGAAILIAANVFGSAASIRTRRNCDQRPPPYTRIRSRLALFGDRNPLSVPIIVVKNTEMAARKMIIVCTCAKATWMIGATAMMGVQ
ncbi:Uncharacterised protein [Mycobacteroides abscessus subsp. abscessus]|nr:Uncharacterised protein [Mycobacteroides abscessus subsp. abscessus]